MGSIQRRWTVEQANAALAPIGALVDSVRRAVARDQGRDGLTGGDPRLLVNGAVQILAVDGVVLRDLDKGLIDFPATAPSGRDYWLCWVVGEQAVTWWHWPEDGFGGRTPIDQPPA